MALTVPVNEIVEKMNNPLLAVHESWGRIRLGEIAEVINGFAFKSSQFSNTEGLPLVRIRDVGKNYTETNYIGDYDERYLVNPGDLLVGMDGDFNCARWRGPMALLNQRVCKIVVSDSRYSERFLDFVLPGYLKAINDVTSSVTVKHLSSKTIQQIPLPYPPLEIQERISDELAKQCSRLDEAVANLKRVKFNLKRYKASVLKAAVEGRLVETEAEIARREGRDYETGEQLLERILETRRKEWKGKGKYKEHIPPDVSDLPELQEGWVWATLPQLGELNRGKSKHRPRDDKKLYGGAYPFIQTGDVRKSAGTITEYSQTYSEFGLSQSRLWPAGTLCITIAANIAETGILKFPACFPDSVVGFLFEDDEIVTRYVECFIRTAREKLERFAPATAQKNINLEVLNAVTVSLPPLCEQYRIVAEIDRRLSLIREVEKQVDANIIRLDRLWQSILSNAYSGALTATEESQRVRQA